MLARMRPSKPSYVGDMSPSATRWNAMAQVLLVSDIRRPTLQSDCKSSTETSWHCRKREAGRNRSITTSVGDKHGLPRQRELRGDRSSAMQRPSPSTPNTPILGVASGTHPPRLGLTASSPPPWAPAWAWLAGPAAGCRPKAQRSPLVPKKSKKNRRVVCPGGGDIGIDGAPQARFFSRMRFKGGKIAIWGAQGENLVCAQNPHLGCVHGRFHPQVGF